MHKNTKKVLHICIIIVIIVAIAFTALMLVLNYDENGETNMPFYISKISIISTTDAQDVENNSNKWDKIINLNNDIYIYIDKNEDYNKTETIKKITINNFRVAESPSKGELCIYRPSEDENTVFKNKDENKVTEIIFDGGMSTDLQNLQVANQGGKIAFRCANNNIGKYVSDNDNEINYNELLKKIDVKYEDISAKIHFDIEIELSSGRKFLATSEMDIPVEDVVEKGTTGKEITDLENIVFKRIEN